MCGLPKRMNKRRDLVALFFGFVENQVQGRGKLMSVRSNHTLFLRNCLDCFYRDIQLVVAKRKDSKLFDSLSFRNVSVGTTHI